jgi:hypothetical protein
MGMANSETLIRKNTLITQLDLLASRYSPFVLRR